MMQVVRIAVVVAFMIAVFLGAGCGVALKVLSIGNQRWTNYGVNFWSPYPPQLWINLGLIAEHETGRTRLLALVARKCLLALAAMTPLIVLVTVIR
jgi:hypothetical protein